MSAALARVVDPTPSTNGHHTGTPAAGKSSTVGKVSRARDPARAGFRHRFARALLLRLNVSVTVRDVCEICAVDRATVYNWLNEANEPGGWALLRLQQALGRDFADEVAGVVPLKSNGAR